MAIRLHMALRANPGYDFSSVRSPPERSRHALSDPIPKNLPTGAGSDLSATIPAVERAKTRPLLTGDTTTTGQQQCTGG